MENMLSGSPLQTGDFAGAAITGGASPSVQWTTDWWERAVLSVLIAWVAFGLAVDTRSHREAASIDSFFTRSHALAYAAGSACAVFLLFLARRRQSAGARGLRVFGSGLESAYLGLGVYVLGGLGDLIWHTAFGVEQELKILFSPTHLLLMTAMVMLGFAPIRAAWMTADPSSSAGRTSAGPSSKGEVHQRITSFWPIALAAGMLMAVLNIFFTYASPFEQPIFTTELPLLLNQFSQFFHVSASMGVFIHTVVLFGLMLLLARRWSLPLGSFTLAFLVLFGSMYVYFDWEIRRTAVAALLGGVACDVLNVVLRLIKNARLRFRSLGFTAPIVFWIVYLLVTMNGKSITWSAEQWTGTIAWSGLLGLAITVVLLPPTAGPRGYLD
jgi:hypothetical protein